MLPSGGEVILILLAVLIFFGAKDLPRVVRTMGQWAATFRRAMNDVRSEFNAIAIQEELKKTRDMMYAEPPATTKQDKKDADTIPDEDKPQTDGIATESPDPTTHYPEEANRPSAPDAPLQENDTKPAENEPPSSVEPPPADEPGDKGPVPRT